MSDENDCKTRLALMEQKLGIIWRTLWAIIAFGAVWIANNILGLLKVGGS